MASNVISVAELIGDARDGYHMTTRMIAENSIARKLRHNTNLAINAAAAKHLSEGEANKVRWQLAGLVSRDMAGMRNNEVAMATSTMQHQNALRVNNGLVGGGGDGARHINPMDVAVRTRMAHKQALVTQRFTASDYMNWVRTMGTIYNIGQNNAAFMREMALSYAPTADRLASISDDQVTALAARGKYLASRYGTSDNIEMTVENPEAFAPGVLSRA